MELSVAMDAEGTVATIAAMRLQEERIYQKKDWLKIVNPVASSALDADCRFRMISWAFAVAEYCHVSKETVEIAFSLVDRFLALPEEGYVARKERSVYQLICMAALYTSIKIHETTAMSPDLLARFSDGVFTSQDIQIAERLLLSYLQWQVNPPTCASFCRSMMDLLPPTILAPEMRSVALDLASFQAKNSVTNHNFMSVPSSTIAYACLMNALECLLPLTRQALVDIGRQLGQYLSIDCSSLAVKRVQAVLYESIDAQWHHPHAPLPRSKNQAAVACHTAVHSHTGKVNHGAHEDALGTSPRLVNSTSF